MSTKHQQIEFLRSSLNSGKWVRGVLFFQSKILASYQEIVKSSSSSDDNTPEVMLKQAAKSHVINGVSLLMPDILRRGVWQPALHTLQQTKDILPPDEQNRYTSAIRRMCVTDPVRLLHALESNYCSDKKVFLSMFDGKGRNVLNTSDLVDHVSPGSTDCLPATLLPLNMKTVTRIKVLDALKGQRSNARALPVPASNDNSEESIALDILSSSSHISAFLPWKYCVKMFVIVHFRLTMQIDKGLTQGTDNMGTSFLYNLSEDNINGTIGEENELLLDEHDHEVFNGSKKRRQSQEQMKYTNDAEGMLRSSWFHLSNEIIRQSIELNTMPSLLRSLSLALGYPTGGEWDESVTAAESSSSLSSSTGPLHAANLPNSKRTLFSLSALAGQKSPYHGNIPHRFVELRTTIHERVVEPVFNFLVGSLYRSQSDHVSDEGHTSERETPYFSRQLSQLLQQFPITCREADDAIMNKDPHYSCLSLPRSIDTTLECLELLLELEAGRLRDALCVNKGFTPKGNDLDNRGPNSQKEGAKETTHRLVILLSRIQNAVKRTLKPLCDVSAGSTSVSVYNLLSERLYKLERIVVRSLASTLSCMRGSWAESLCVASSSVSSLLGSSTGHGFGIGTSKEVSRTDRLVAHSIVHSLSTSSNSSSSNHFQVLKLLLDKIEKMPTSVQSGQKQPFDGKHLITALSNGTNGFGGDLTSTSLGDVEIVDFLVGGDFWRHLTNTKEKSSLQTSANDTVDSSSQNSSLLLTPSQRKVLINALYPTSLFQSNIVRDHYGEKLRHIPRYYNGDAWWLATAVLVGSFPGTSTANSSINIEGVSMLPLGQQHPSADLPHMKLPLEAIKVLGLCCYGGAPANVFTALHKNVFFPRKFSLHKGLYAKTLSGTSDDHVMGFGVNSIYYKGSIPNESDTMAVERKKGKSRISKEQYRHLCFCAAEAVQAAKTHPISWTGWRCALEVACGVLLLDVHNTSEKEAFRQRITNRPISCQQSIMKSTMYNNNTRDMVSTKRSTEDKDSQKDAANDIQIWSEEKLEGPQLQLYHAIRGFLIYRGLARGNTTNMTSSNGNARPHNTPSTGQTGPHQWHRALERYARLCSNCY